MELTWQGDPWTVSVALGTPFDKITSPASVTRNEARKRRFGSFGKWRGRFQTEAGDLDGRFSRVSQSNVTSLV